MRRTGLVLTAVAVLGGATAYLAPAPGQADGDAAPICGVKLAMRPSSATRSRW